MTTDSNFCFPVRELSNERVKLVSFNPALHSATFFNLCKPQEQTLTHLRAGPYTDPEALTREIFDQIIQPDPGAFLFAVIDKTIPPRDGNNVDKDGSVAGMIAYLASSAVHLHTEIGFVITLPPFQKTHVTSNAVGLLLQYALGSPSQSNLGLRRVEWQVSSMNAPSRRLAEKFGFQFEGTRRWDYVYRDGKLRGKTGNGRGVPPEANENDTGRDSDILSLCWDDWEGGAREKAQAIMDRR